MERFFIVDKKCPLYKPYFEYEACITKIAKVFEEISERFGIESSRYLPLPGQLKIVPTEADNQKFKDQFILKRFDAGLRAFKAKSPVNIAWKEAIERDEIKFMFRPNPSWNLGFMSKCHYRLFEHKGKLYFSIEYKGDGKEKISEGLTEIKGSEFWLIIEDICKNNEISNKIERRKSI